MSKSFGKILSFIIVIAMAFSFPGTLVAYSDENNAGGDSEIDADIDDSDDSEPEAGVDSDSDIDVEIGIHGDSDIDIEVGIILG